MKGLRGQGWPGAPSYVRPLAGARIDVDNPNAIPYSWPFPSEGSGGKRIPICRKERKIVVNVSAIMRGRDKNKDINLLPGDIVSVPETIF